MRTRLVGLLFMALSSPLMAAPEHVTAIDVVGNQAISTPTILAQVHSQVGASLDVHAVEQDVASIRDMGDFSAVTVQETTGPSGLHLVFRVVENPILRSVDLRGNHVASTQKLVALMQVQIGQPLNTRVLNADISVINRYYGACCAETSSRVRPGPASTTALCR